MGKNWTNPNWSHWEKQITASIFKINMNFIRNFSSKSCEGQEGEFYFIVRISYIMKANCK